MFPFLESLTSQVKSSQLTQPHSYKT
jgi:hypothetical protein